MYIGTSLIPIDLGEKYPDTQDLVNCILVTDVVVTVLKT